MPYRSVQLPFDTTPPVSQWTGLSLPPYGGVTELRRVRMNALAELRCDDNPIADLPWDDLQALTTLSVYGTAFETLPLWRLPNLCMCWTGYTSSLTCVDAHGLENLSELGMGDCPALEEINIDGCTSLQFVYVSYCGLPQETVDQLLADLVANGVANGWLDMYGNAAPSSPEGLALRAVLISRGWGVNY